MMSAVIMLLLLLEGARGQASITINVDNGLAGFGPTNYNFELTKADSIVIPAGSSLVIQFSYVLAAGTGCAIMGGPWTGTSLTCTYSGYTVTVTGGFTTSTNLQSSYYFQLQGLTNPPSASTLYLTASLGTSAVTVYSTLTAQFTFSPSTMACSLAPANLLVGATSLYSFSFTTSLPLASITFTLPSSWSQDPLARVVISSNVFCGGSGVTSSVACSYRQIGTVRQVLVTPFASGSTYTGSFTVQISTWTNPPSTMPSDYISIMSYDSGSNPVQTCSVQVSGLQPNLLLSTVVGPGTVQSTASLTLSFASQSTLRGQDSLLLTFPTQFVVSSISKIQLSSPSTQTLAFSVFGQSVSVPNLISSSLTSVLIGPTNIVLTINGVGFPSSTQPCATPFNIKIQRNSFPIDQGNLASYTAQAGTLSALSVSPSNSQIGLSTTYTFRLTLTNSLCLSASATCKIKVSLPAAVSGTTIPGCISSSLSGPCAFSSPVLSLTLTGSAAAGTTITFSAGPFTNAAGVGSQTFTFQSQQDGYTVDRGSAQAAYSAGVLAPSDVQIVPASLVCGATTLYTFTIKNKNALPSNGYLMINLPSQISPPDTASLSCQTIAGSVLPCTYSASAIKVQGLATSGLSANALASIPFTIQMINPISTAPSNSFQISTYTLAGVVIDQLLSGVAVTMATGAPLPSLFVTRSSTVNSALNSIAVSFLPAASTPAAVTLVLTFSMGSVPNSIVVTGGPVSSCSLGATSTCSLTVSAAWPSTTITISIKNYKSLQAANLQASVLTADSLYTYYKSTISITNTIAASLPLTFSLSPQILGQATALTLSLSPPSTLTSGEYIKITFQSDFRVAGSSCSSGVGFAVSCSVLGSAITVTSTAGGFPATVTFTLQITAAPKSSPSSYVIIQTYSQSGFLKEGSYTAVQFTAGCTLPCRTCTNPTSSTACSNCYTDASIASGNILLKDTTCVMTCPTGFYDTGGNLCSSCSGNCAECSGTATTCVSCPASAPILFNSLCYSTCPTGTYTGPSGGCINCISVCAACTSTSVCTDCVSPGVLSVQTCVTSCPSGYGPDSARVCTRCPTVCVLCTTSTQCTSCSSGYNLDAGSCRTSCQTAGTFASAGICLSCQSPCLTCTTSAYKCGSCSSTSVNKYLYNENCVSSCPLLYFALGTQCTACTTPCLLCTSQALCQSCASGSLYLSTCVTTCPATFYSSSQVCTSCQSPCAACSSATHCLTCTGSLLLQLSSCVSTCTAPSYVARGSTCVACTSPCQTCITSPTNCLSCVSNYLLSASQCVSSCPVLTYPSGGQCLACSNTCLNCAGSATICTSCAVGKYLHQGTCSSTCPSNLLAYSGSCVSCASECTVCAVTPTQCSACRPGYQLTQALLSCSVSCPQGYYNGGSGSCVPCKVICTGCLSDTICTSCNTGFFLNAGQCFSGCPPQYYNNNGKCQACSAACFNCSGPSYCTSCPSSQYLYQGSCSNTCPAASPYALDGLCLSCNIRGCVICMSSTACSNCSSGLLISPSYGCTSSCPLGSTQANTTCVGQTVIDSSGTLAFFPLPFLLAFLLGLAVLCISKHQHPESDLVQALLALISLLLAASIFYALGITIPYPGSITQKGILGGAAGALLLTNLVHLFIYVRKFKAKSCLVVTFLAISTFTSCPFIRILRSKLLGVAFFDNFQVGPAYWMLLFLPPAFVGCVAGVFVAVTSVTASRPFFAGIECTLLGSLGIVFTVLSILNAREDDARWDRVQQLAQKYVRVQRIKTEPQVPSKVQLFQRKNSDPTFEHQPEDSRQVPVMLPMQVPSAIEAGAFRKKKNIFNDLFVIEEQDQPPFIKQLGVPTLQQIRAKRQQEVQQMLEKEFERNISLHPAEKGADDWQPSQDKLPALRPRAKRQLSRQLSRRTGLNQSEDDGLSDLGRPTRYGFPPRPPGRTSNLQAYLSPRQDFPQSRGFERQGQDMGRVTDAFESKPVSSVPIEPDQFEWSRPVRNRPRAERSEYINDVEQGGLQVQQLLNNSSQRIQLTADLRFGESNDARPGQYLDWKQEQPGKGFSFSSKEGRGKGHDKPARGRNKKFNEKRI